MLPLVYVFFDIGSAMFFLVAFVSTCVAIYSLSRRVVWNAFAHWKDWKYLIPAPRPVLTIFAYMLVSTAAGQSVDAADRFASDTAASMQKLCDRDRRCPQSVEPWRIAGKSGTAVSAGKWSKYEVNYQASEDRSSFEITIIFSMDGWKVYTGGVGKPVSVRSSVA